MKRINARSIALAMEPPVPPPPPEPFFPRQVSVAAQTTAVADQATAPPEDAAPSEPQERPPLPDDAVDVAGDHSRRCDTAPDNASDSASEGGDPRSEGRRRNSHGGAGADDSDWLEDVSCGSEQGEEGCHELRAGEAWPTGEAGDEDPCAFALIRRSARYGGVVAIHEAISSIPRAIPIDMASCDRKIPVVATALLLSNSGRSSLPPAAPMSGCCI